MGYYYTDDEGKFLVRLARKTVETYVTKKERIHPPQDTPEKLKKESGVFVTLNRLIEREKKKHELRGCIGYPLPIKPLVEATIDVAIEAATADPRFHPVTPSELDSIVVEVSILTPPKVIEVNDPLEYPAKIEIGRDGLIVEYGFYRGLLLPQVPVEEKWDVVQFLSYTCYKAGLPANCWKKKDITIKAFQAEIFEEVEPRDKIRRKEI